MMSINNIPSDVYAKFLLTDGKSDKIGCSDCIYFYKRGRTIGSCTIRIDGHRNSPKECKDFEI